MNDIGHLDWPDSAAPERLGPDDIHVWSASLTLPAERQQRLASVLSEDERERAGRFRFDHLQKRFAAGRGWLRLILGRYLSAAPAQIDFSYSSLGKPALAEPFSQSGLHFNLAHSEDAALVAVTRIGPVGVDIEKVRVMNDAEGLVKRFFSARESQAFRNLGPEERPGAFFNLWTRKEAMLKASGEGITGSLSEVEVSFLSGEPARVIAMRGDTSEAAAWQLRALAPRPGFVAAAAIRSANAHVRFGTIE